jgi:hypothetical protein
MMHSFVVLPCSKAARSHIRRSLLGPCVSGDSRGKDRRVYTVNGYVDFMDTNPALIVLLVQYFFNRPVNVRPELSRRWQSHISGHADTITKIR